MTENYTRTISALISALSVLSDCEFERRVLDVLPALIEQRARHWTKGAHGYFTGSWSDGAGGGSAGGKGLDKSAGSGIIKARQSIKISLQHFAEIPKEKFTKYALDPLKQPDKARAFREALGYTMDNYQELIDNISANLDESALKLKGSNDHGQLYEYVMRITGANGKQANVCTGWIIENGKTEPRLTSAYVTEKKVTKKDDD